MSRNNRRFFKLSNGTLWFKTVSLIAVMLFLQSCCAFIKKDNLTFSQGSQLVAENGGYYHDKIKILGANIHILSIKNHEPYYENAHLHNGLTVSTYHPESNYFIEISGISNVIGKEEFTVVGEVSGTQCSGYKFEKTFTIITVEKNEPSRITQITPTDTQITTTCL